MNRLRVLVLTTLLCIPAAAFAGAGQGRNIPTLSEIGLLILAASLVGGGALVLRRGKR